jgi:hypothetical protein
MELSAEWIAIGVAVLSITLLLTFTNIAGNVESGRRQKAPPVRAARPTPAEKPPLRMVVNTKLKGGV